MQERNIRALQSVIQEYMGQNIIVGSHGTAMSIVINLYDRRFGYEDFERIRRKMPWVVEFVFDNHQQMLSIREHEL